MEPPTNADADSPLDRGETRSSRRAQGSRGKPGFTWRGPGGVRVSLVGLVGVVLVAAGVLALTMSGNTAFGSGVVVVGFGVLLIDALRAR